MAKIIKNTTASDILVAQAGISVPAMGQYEIEVRDYSLWATVGVITEISSLITSGDLVVNDGINDLTSFYGLAFLQYPDAAFNARFLSEPERSNGFASKTIQEAVEEAASGIITSLAPTTTIGAMTVVAYSATLVADTAYKFKMEVDARRTDAVGETAIWEVHTRVKRDGASPAALVGNTFQALCQRDDQQMDIYWDVSGNQVQLKVVGVAGKTIKWQPRVSLIKVS